MKIRLFLLVAYTLAACSFGCSSDVSKNLGNANKPASNTSNIQSANNSPANLSKPQPVAAKPDALGGRISFEKGENSSTVSGSVIRGERATYFLGAKVGQKMSVMITSEENNAVFQIENPAGKYLNKAGESDDAMTWSGSLPVRGDYKIIVGPTRGNASYKLTVSIK